MADYGITENGFELKRLDVIMEEVHSDLSEGFGFNTRLQDSSFLDVLVTTFCNQIADLWETAQDSYYAKFPTTAEGVNLDNAMQFGGVTRQSARQTTYPLHCTGVDGTEVETDAIVGSNTNPQIELSPVSAFTISRENCNALSIKLAVVGTDAYTVTFGENPYSYTPTAEQTEIEVLNGIKAAITETGYTITVDEENALLVISDDTKSRSNNISLSDNLTTESVTTVASFNTADYGKITIPDGLITEFVSNTAGFDAVTNMLSPTYGCDAETDIEARSSYVLKSALRSNTMIDSIVSELYDNVSGVESASGYENDSNETDSNGIPPHSIEIVVEGGQDTDIANSILNRKAGGIGTYGSTTVDVVGKYGDTIAIKFSRPEYIYTWLKVKLHGKSSEIASNYEKLSKSSIMDFVDGLVAGTDLLTQKLIEGIYSEVAGVNYVDLFEAHSTDSAFTPTDDDYVEGNISATNRQKVLLSADRIEVVFSADT